MAKVRTKDGRWIDIIAPSEDSGIFEIVDGKVCINVPDDDTAPIDEEEE